MRIVHVMTHLRLGAGRAIVDLCLEQRRRGHDVHLACSTDAEGAWATSEPLVQALADGGVPTTVVGDLFHRDPVTLAAAVRGVRPVIAPAASTVVHAHTAMCGAVAHWAGARRLVVTCHGWNPERPASFDVQDALAFSLAGAIVSPATAWARRVETLPGVGRVHVLPYGFDLTGYPAAPRRRPLGRPQILCVGELTARKGQDVLLAALPAVWAQRPDTRVVLMGAGDAEQALRAQAARLDPGGSRLEFRGYVDRPYDEMRHADLLCLPARSDNQPVVIVEALLADLPVVATAVGGIPEMIERAGAGMVVPPDDPEALAAALVGMLDTARTAVSTRSHAEATYGIAAVATRLDALYEGLADTGRP